MSLIAEGFVMNEVNTPTRVGELIGTIEEIYDIPTPRVGMLVYVKDEGKNYIVRSLKEKVINGVTVQNAQVDKYELFEIDNIPTGGGGTGDIADGAVTEKKLSTDVKNKLNTAYDKANLADSLFLNDGIVFKKGVLIEGGVRESVTGYAYSNKILGNGETITVDEGYKIVNYKLYEGEEELWFDNNYNKTTIPLDKGYVYQFSVMRDGGSAITNYNNIVKSFIRNPYAWDNYSNLNNFICAGRYVISGSREANAQDNMPIYNSGKVEARLEVIENENTLVQILSLLNVGGGDGNIYTRVRQNGAWEPWGKLQTNIEVGRVEGNNAFDSFTDNGMYSGVYVYGSTAETFVLVVINAYLYGGGVSQLKYSTLLDDTTTVKLRTRVNDSWGEWQGLGGGSSYTLPIATDTTLGGVKVTKSFLNSSGLKVDEGQLSLNQGGIKCIVPAFDNINDKRLLNIREGGIYTGGFYDGDNLYPFILVVSYNLEKGGASGLNFILQQLTYVKDGNIVMLNRVLSANEKDYEQYIEWQETSISIAEEVVADGNEAVSGKAVVNYITEKGFLQAEETDEEAPDVPEYITKTDLDNAIMEAITNTINTPV